MADSKTLTHDEIIKLLTDKAKEGDNFTIKISRRKIQGGPPEMVASFSGATVWHIANPELWLPKLAGGGPTFIVQVFHQSDPTSHVGILQYQVPTDSMPAKAPGEMDTAMVRSGSWDGPKTLLWPVKEEKKADSISSYSIPSMSPVPPPGNSAATNVPGEGNRGQFFVDEARRALETERERFRQLQLELLEDKRRTELEAVKRDNDMRLESLKRDSESRAAQLEQRVLAALQAQTQAPKTDITQTISSILAAAGPILISLVESNKETRNQMLKQQQDSAAQMQTLITTLLAKPQTDPYEKMFDKVEKILDRQQGQQVPQTTMLHSMAEAMSSITSTTMELVHAAADLNLGGGVKEEHPALKAVREGVKAITSVMAGYQQALPHKQAQAAQQLPPGYAEAVAQQQAALRAQQQARQPVPQAPQAVPQQPHAAQLHNVAPPVAVQPLPYIAVPQGLNALDTLVEMVKVQAPVADVVALFLKAFKDGDDSLHAALAEEEGDLREVFAKRLTGFFLANPDAVSYLPGLFSEVDRRGSAEGIFESDNEEPNEADYEEEEDTENA